MAEKCPYMNRSEDEHPYHNPGYCMPHGGYEGDGISLRELLLVLIRGKKTIIWITIIVFLVSIAGTMIVSNVDIGTKGTVETAVQLYFSGIETGQTPSGGIYDVNEIKSADVLQNAIGNIDFGSQTISLEKLRRNISFQAVVPDSVAKTLENLKDIKSDEIKIERLEALSGYSDIYVVKLNLASDLGLDEEQGRMLLDNIILEYKEYLIYKYGNNAVLADIFASDIDLGQYDYIQAAGILNDQLERMELYVSRNMPRTDVHSTVTGLNPADISSALESLRNVDMERIYTMIGAFYLTKDPAKAVALYEQLADDKEIEAAQHREETAAIKTAITGYKKSEQTIVLGDMISAPITLTSENKGYNDLVTRFIEAGTMASNAAQDAAYYRSEAERFKTAMPLTRENSLEAAQAEENINLLQGKLVYWTGVINDTAEDYYSAASYQRYAEQLMTAGTYEKMEEGQSMLLIAAIGLILGLVLGVLVVLFRAYIREDQYILSSKGVAGDEAE
ncbi:MAG: hypothetical protein PHE79_01625 [Eubacteriales bacterium]|nr:hypothetical protein [Eubacteriales bacterium]